MDIQGRLQLMLSRNWGAPIILPALQPCNKAYGIRSTNKWLLNQSTKVMTS